MKILKAFETEKLIFASTRSKNQAIYLTASQMEVGESLKIERSDWKSPGVPTLNNKKSLQGKKFQTRKLADGGFIVNRIQ